MGDLMQLFDDYCRRYLRGERPDVREYLDRAGTEQEELSRLIDRYLATAPPPEPEPATVAAMGAWLAGKPPLLDLRRQRGLGRDVVVDEIVGSLELDPGKREKVKSYLHRLETGSLDPAGVSRRVWEVLERLLGAGARSLAGLRPPPVAPRAAYRRADAGFALMERVVDAAPAAEGPDEVDMLFTAGD
jgi:AcrR family transcriptional regulator